MSTDQESFRAIAHREQQWWVVEVDGVGVTQGRNLEEAQAMAEDLVAIATERSVDTFRVMLELDLAPELSKELSVARADHERLEAEAAAASARLRALLPQLSASGLTGTDIATLLRLSKQRVSQLLRVAVR